MDFIKIIDVINISHFKSLFQAVSTMSEWDNLMNEIKKSNFDYFVLFIFFYLKINEFDK